LAWLSGKFKVPRTRGARGTGRPGFCGMGGRMGWMVEAQATLEEDDDDGTAQGKKTRWSGVVSSLTIPGQVSGAPAQGSNGSSARPALREVCLVVQRCSSRARGGRRGGRLAWAQRNWAEGMEPRKPPVPGWVQVALPVQVPPGCWKWAVAQVAAPRCCPPSWSRDGAGVHTRGQDRRRATAS